MFRLHIGASSEETRKYLQDWFIAHKSTVCGNPHNSSHWKLRITRQLGW